MKKNINSSIKFLMLLLMGGVLAACATIIDGGPTKPVRVSSAEVGKEFVIKDKYGAIIHSGVTPAIVQLPRSGDGFFEAQRYTISLKDGSGTSAMVSSRVTGWYIAGNLVFGGIIGWLAVDPSTGAMYTLKPEQVNLY